MKTDVEACKTILDNLIFNDPRIKPLVEQGFVKSKSVLQYDKGNHYPDAATYSLRYVVVDRANIHYYYKYFGQDDAVFSCRLSNLDADDKYLFGFEEPNALKKAAEHVIKELTYNANPCNREEHERRFNEAMCKWYAEGHYEGD